ncbi:MAG TPA: hypothetical protein PKI61_01770 [bacterium]|nr:hypothetical protein [bacterium]HPT30143.1 hypothetical protein [bacterium]
MQTNDFNSFSQILAARQPAKTIKPPAHPWQDLALRIIQELGVPAFKRSAVFKVCRDYPQNVIQAALTDTKELCTSGQKWAYFFKVIDSIDKQQKENK